VFDRSRTGVDRARGNRDRQHLSVSVVDRSALGSERNLGIVLLRGEALPPFVLRYLKRIETPEDDARPAECHGEKEHEPRFASARTKPPRRHAAACARVVHLKRSYGDAGACAVYHVLSSILRA